MNLVEQGSVSYYFSCCLKFDNENFFVEFLIIITLGAMNYGLFVKFTWLITVEK